jgi:hypothetical protein
LQTYRLSDVEQGRCCVDSTRLEEKDEDGMVIVVKGNLSLSHPSSSCIQKALHYPQPEPGRRRRYLTSLSKYVQWIQKL